jgi:hypothetical protein
VHDDENCVTPPESENAALCCSAVRKLRAVQRTAQIRGRDGKREEAPAIVSLARGFGAPGHHAAAVTGAAFKP